MAAHVLRLRVALLFGALRGDARHVVRVVLGVLVLAFATAVGCWGLLALREATVTVTFAVTVLAGSAVTLGFVLAPLMASGSDPLDPRRFVVLGIPAAPLAGVLALAGLLSVPILALIALGVCLVLAWDAHGVSWMLSALAVFLGIAGCAMLARVSTALTALFLRERQSRELTGVLTLVVLVVVVPVGVFLASLQWRGTVPTQLREAVDVLARTPLGAAWAFPGRLAEGAESAWVSLTIAFAWLAVLGLLWLWLVHRMLTTTERPMSVRDQGGLGWFAVAPGTPGGAVAARSLTYWLRDRRYLVNIVVIPFAAGIMMVPLLFAGVPMEYVILVPLPIAALFLGWLPHNDLAYDSTAVWLHITSGMRGVSDRVGRLVPVILVTVPVFAVAIPLVMVVHGRWALLPALTGVCAGLFLVGLGLSSIASVAAPYAVTRPGDSPFQQPQRQGAGGAVTQGVVLLGAIALSAPTLWWAWSALTVDIDDAVVALWSGLGIGVGVLVIGVAIGSLVFTRRGGQLMEFAEST